MIKLLPHKDRWENKTFNWVSGEKEKYESFKTWQAEHELYYKDLEISYSFNSEGFRAPEFDTIEWGNSWAFVGCSNMMGEGNRLEDTIPYLVEKQINEPCINLGSVGYCNTMIFLTALKLLSQVNPKRLVVLWIHNIRSTYYPKKGELLRSLNKDLEDTFVNDEKKTPINYKSLTGIIEGIEHHCNWRVEIYESILKGLAPNSIILHYNDFLEVEGLKQARDRRHPSWKWNTHVANEIVKISKGKL